MKLSARKIIVAAITAAGLAVPLASTAASASSARVPAAMVVQHSRLSPASTGLGICLGNAPQYCWTSPGSGSQVTISNGSPANISAVNTYNANGNYHAQYQNSHGNCFYVNGSQQLIEGSNPCSSSRTDEYFTVYAATCGSAICYSGYSDMYSGHAIITFNDANGKPVWVETLQAGMWSKWLDLAQ